ncbi:hypothetical protein L4C38_08010 [Vibrio kasasachensis]|uniref:hypothetical protein n=1 Tax=Vibrio kasasachensis TaxID=2910248 RepID=UPI003D0FBA71
MQPKWLVISSLVIVVAIMIATKPSSEGLELPDCDATAIVDTEINFIVDQEVLDASNQQQVEAYFTQSIKQSNIILRNSCIPMTRSLGTVRYIDLDKNDVHDIYTLHKQLETQLNSGDLGNQYPQANQFYGFVLAKKYSDMLGYAGQVEFNLSRKFFAITHNNGLTLIEHELGHLAWAQHAEGHPFNLQKWLESTILPEFHHFLKPYARAYKCGTGGTVMSYEDEILPIYSNPDSYYRGKVCGDAENGNNARMLIEQAHRIAEQMPAL